MKKKSNEIENKLRFFLTFLIHEQMQYFLTW